MAFAMNYKDLAQGPELLPEGEYEVVIETAMETATDRGTPFISIKCRVRADVPQACHGRVIFYDLWLKRTPTPEDAAFDGYSAKQILSLSRAAGLADGAQFDGIDDWCDALVGRAVRLVTYHDTYNGRTNTRVRYANETKYPEGVAPPEQSAGRQVPPHPSTAQPQTPSPQGEGFGAPTSGFQPLDDDDDLPF